MLIVERRLIGGDIEELRALSGYRHGMAASARVIFGARAPPPTRSSAGSNSARDASFVGGSPPALPY
jgi:hypothetical protein